jgi:MarR family transcriptional regulator, organic hydroperoxide resistance regulator
MVKPGNKPKKSTARADDQDLVRSIDAFRRILRELRLHARRAELATGLSPSQAFVLTMIAQRPGASVNEIAEATMTDRSSAAAVLDRLAERGHVVRQQSDRDRRRAEFRITTSGRRAMQRAPTPPTVALVNGISALSRAQRRALAESLTVLTQAMGLGNEPAGMLFDDPTDSRRQTTASRTASGTGRNPRPRGSRPG